MLIQTLLDNVSNTSKLCLCRNYLVHTLGGNLFIAITDEYVVVV